LRPRARQLISALEGQPGLWNAITDVPGLEVGHYTLVSGESVRTGVTVILPQGRQLSGLPASWFALNGNGELTGTAWVDESGFLEGPIALTNTCSVGLVRDTLRRWLVENFPLQTSGLGLGLLPVVGETWDGLLNDIEAQQLGAEHVLQALQQAASGPVAEGNVGGGTGMMAFEFKAGIGTSSRLLQFAGQTYVLGVLVQANFGWREHLLLGGQPMGKLLQDLKPRLAAPRRQEGSIVAVLATNLPLLPHQLKRLARRMSLGLARTGGLAFNSSGDLFLAVSTAYPQLDAKGYEAWRVLPNASLDPVFAHAAWATEEAILNALFAADDMQGFQGNQVYALPLARLQAILSQA